MANVPDTEPRTPSVNRRHLAYQLVDDAESAVTIVLLGNRWDSSHTMRMGLAGLADSMLWRSSVSDHTHDGDDGHVVELGVVQTVEQVDRSGTGGRHTHPDPTRELGIAGGGERDHFLVTGLNKLRFVVCAAKRRHQPLIPSPG